jgi:hypothetical protein
LDYILVDVARRKQAQKRQAIEAEDLLLQTAKNSAMLRVFANLEFEEIAEHQNVHVRTARRDWVAAMALLKERGN